MTGKPWLMCHKCEKKFRSYEAGEFISPTNRGIPEEDKEFFCHECIPKIKRTQV